MLGSTSEVAKAICRELARQGCKRFHLVARNGEVNQQLAVELQQSYGAAISTEQTDLLADSSLEPARCPAVGEFDLYLITAGSLGDAQLARSDGGEALRILAANVGGLLPWITAIATPERLAKPGRLWVFSSVAADRGRPSNTTTAPPRLPSRPCVRGCCCAATASHLRCGSSRPVSSPPR